MCSDIETVYNYSHSNPITVAQNEIENKDVNDNKEDQIQKLLKTPLIFRLTERFLTDIAMILNMNTFT